jgi:hypothetical protein
MRSRSEGSEVGETGDAGGVLLPKPRAFRRAARPGEGLRGWRTVELDVKGRGGALVGVRLSVASADGDGVVSLGLADSLQQLEG